MKHFKFLNTALAIAVAAALVGACSSDSDEDTNTTAAVAGESDKAGGESEAGETSSPFADASGDDELDAAEAHGLSEKNVAKEGETPYWKLNFKVMVPPGHWTEADGECTINNAGDLRLTNEYDEVVAAVAPNEARVGEASIVETEAVENHCAVTVEMNGLFTNLTNKLVISIGDVRSEVTKEEYFSAGGGQTINLQ